MCVNREKKKTDKGIVMTHIFKKSFPGHRSRSADEELVLAINPTNGRILNYQQTTNLKKLSFPLVSFRLIHYFKFDQTNILKIPSTGNV